MLKAPPVGALIVPSGVFSIDAHFGWLARVQPWSSDSSGARS
jgi:hypothetical protein